MTTGSISFFWSFFIFLPFLGPFFQLWAVFFILGRFCIFGWLGGGYRGGSEGVRGGHSRGFRGGFWEVGGQGFWGVKGGGQGGCLLKPQDRL